MKGGYESLVWLNDKDGKEYVCFADDHNAKRFEELTEQEQRSCENVNQIVGTERW